MKEIFANFTFFGVVISLAGYELGILLKKKFKFPLLNPLLVSIVFVIGFLVLFRIDYDTYNNGAKYLSYLLTPATVCLAIPLYQQMDCQKKYAGCHTWNSFRCTGKFMLYTDFCVFIRNDTQRICYHAAKIYHNSDWNGSFRRTGRYCDHYHSNDYSDRNHRKYYCRNGVPDL